MNKTWTTAIVMIISLTMLAGCGKKPEASAPTENDTVQGSQVSQDLTNQGASQKPMSKDDNTVSAAPGTNTGDGKASASNTDKKESTAQKTEHIKVYYADDQLLELKEAERTISFKDEAGKYEAVLQALQKTEDPKLIALWAKIDIKSVKFKNGEVTIDITLPDEARQGTDGELFILDSLKKTLFQFDEVKSIELLVDGQKLDSLMGQADLDHPITRN
ncbi:hypothetical protein DCC85_12410 [Paenibacillus sp. CAA11]|nr:hypothetical protein DCC85_12410 [Paenibacillus sp. CAA11]